MQDGFSYTGFLLGAIKCPPHHDHKTDQVIYTTTMSGDGSPPDMDSDKNEKLETNNSYDFQVPKNCLINMHSFFRKKNEYT